MTFTKTPPSTPGNFTWIANGRTSSRLVQVWKGGCRVLADIAGEHGSRIVSEMGGEWCLLVPAEEIEKAWDEASAIYRPSDVIPLWDKSRAKRVMEGKE